MATEKRLGVVAPVPRGNWSRDTEYKTLNIVNHASASFLAIRQRNNK